ncbi:MAG: hypothetical protein ACOVSW_00870 [Candidatus Kapaibacteriota bacterium]|jgi:alpha-1,6-mannosyltransferase
MSLPTSNPFKTSTSESFSVVLVCLCVYCCLFALYAALPPTRNPHSIQYFLLLVSAHSICGVVLFSVLREHQQYSGFLMIAVFLCSRIAVFPMQPWLSDDAWRYLWDGKLLASGINPYTFPPNASELAVFGAATSELYAHLDYRHLTTIYPPLAQYVFAVAANIGSVFTPSLWGAYWSWKALLLASEGIGLWCVWRTLVAQKRHTTWLWAYICLPLTALEGVGQAHVDSLLLAPLGALVVVLAKAIIVESRREALLLALLAGALVAMLGAIKILPLALALPLLRFRRTPQERLMIVGSLAMVSCGLWVSLFSQWSIAESFLHTASATTQAFQFNGGFYYALCYACVMLGFEHFWLYTPMIFSALRLFAVLVVSFWTKPSNDDVFRALLATFCVVLLVSAKVHTWYFLPLLLLNSLIGWKWLYVLALGSMLSYSYYAVLPAQERYDLEMAVWMAAALAGVVEWYWVRAKPEE